jgi:hemoglobin
MTTQPTRPDVTPAQIKAVMTEFYAKIRLHPMLGPIFAAHVTDWPSHEEKITRFWRNAILQERCYDGRPMQVHRQAGDVRATHFAPWLALFDSVLHQQLPPSKAAAWSAMAHRIGRSFAMGLPAPEGPPILL